MDKLVTANGRELECDTFIVVAIPARCYIRLPGLSFSDAVRIFTDSAETKILTYGDNQARRFTKLQSIGNEGDSLLITLEKE